MSEHQYEVGDEVSAEVDTGRAIGVITKIKGGDDADHLPAWIRVGDKTYPVCTCSIRPEDDFKNWVNRIRNE